MAEGSVRLPRLLPLLGALVAVAAVLGLVAVLTSGGDGQQRHVVVRVDPTAAYGLMQEHAGHTAFRVLDVRTPQEFAQGHLPGATDLDVNDPGFTAAVRRLPRDGTYLVYCHSGNRSARATAAMADLGFRTVYDLRGGIVAWQQQGLPVAS